MNSVIQRTLLYKYKVSSMLLSIDAGFVTSFLFFLQFIYVKSTSDFSYSLEFKYVLLLIASAASCTGGMTMSMSV
jgi:hypothetical protein